MFIIIGIMLTGMLLGFLLRNKDYLGYINNHPADMGPALPPRD